MWVAPATQLGGGSVLGPVQGKESCPLPVTVFSQTGVGVGDDLPKDSDQSLHVLHGGKGNQGLAGGL